MVSVKWIVGIDEAGRGPLAGPVAVGVVLVPADFDWTLVPGVGDSKKLSQKKREQIFETTNKLEQEGKLNFRVVMESAQVIDEIGIVPAIGQALARGLNEVVKVAKVLPEQVQVKLDGGLRAPAQYLHQEIIIRGDASERVIGLASIMAKVTRDQAMVAFASTHPVYGLEVHKGYGTKKHRDAIKKYGLSLVHRRTFCRGCQ